LGVRGGGIRGEGGWAGSCRGHLAAGGVRRRAAAGGVHDHARSYKSSTSASATSHPHLVLAQVVDEGHQLEGRHVQPHVLGTGAGVLRSSRARKGSARAGLGQSPAAAAGRHASTQLHKREGGGGGRGQASTAARSSSRALAGAPPRWQPLTRRTARRERRPACWPSGLTMTRCASRALTSSAATPSAARRSCSRSSSRMRSRKPAGGGSRAAGQQGSRAAGQQGVGSRPALPRRRRRLQVGGLL
jgi:hypothetical protein